MTFLKWVKLYSSLIVGIALVILTVLPQDFHLPRFFLYVGLIFLVFKDLADVENRTTQNLIETRALREELAELRKELGK